MNLKRALALFITLGIMLLGVSRVSGQQAAPQSPQGPYGYAFTYQGQLNDASGPVNGACDLRFSLWDAGSGGTQVGSTLNTAGVQINDGLFTARLDFGAGAHTGAARWLEVAVRCPAGSGAYVTLSPRQELTGAPAALSLALPFRAAANVGGPLASFQNSGDGEAALFGSQAGHALWVERAGLDGLYVASSGQNGLRVVSAGAQGLQVDAAGGTGVYVASAGNPSATVPNDVHNGFEVAGAEGCGLSVGQADLDGAYVSSAGYRGFAVGSAGQAGVYVGAAGADGVFVNRAGNPSATTPDDSPNGFEVAGAERYGLYVGRADAGGVFIDSAGYHGVAVRSAWANGVSVGSVDPNGWAGVWVGQAGNPSARQWSPRTNGFEIEGAEGYGLFVGRADMDGVYVNSTAWHGVNVVAAGVDGLFVTSAGSDGVDVTGNAYAGNFRGNINVTGDCYGCTLTVFGLNAGDRPLEPGQVVAIQGIQASTLDNALALWRVVPAEEGSAAVGVVRGRAELDAAPTGATLREGESGQRLVPRAGSAPSGAYLSIVIYGPLQVKTSAADGPIQPGMRLAVSGAGAARALKTVVVEGVSLAESAPTIGIALAEPDENGLVWVLVNPQ